MRSSASALRCGYDWALSIDQFGSDTLANAEIKRRSGNGRQRREALSLLVRGLSHELNNIWTTIIGQAELITFHLGNEHQAQARIQRVIAGGGLAVSCSAPA